MRVTKSDKVREHAIEILDTGIGNDSKIDPVAQEKMSMRDTLHLEN